MSRPSRHIQVCTGKKHVQSIEIFLQSSVNGLSEPEDVLHNSVGVFHLAAHRGFAMLNVSLPVNGAA